MENGTCDFLTVWFSYATRGYHIETGFFPFGEDDIPNIGIYPVLIVDVGSVGCE